MSNTTIRLENKLRNQYKNPRHLETAASGIFYTCAKNNIDVDSLLDDIDNGTAFDFHSFWCSTSGNLLTHLKPNYHPIAQSIIDITAGGNGGMASIGRSEFFIAFFSNFQAKIITNGNGDISFGGKNEEVKHNGGKITVDAKQGKDIYNIFEGLTRQKNVAIVGKDFLPSRKTDIKHYSLTDYEMLIGFYWQAITGVDDGPMSRQQFQLNCLKRALDRVFQSIDSLLSISESNDYIRFTNSNEAYTYYSQRPNLYQDQWEIRAWQSNPVALYLGV